MKAVVMAGGEGTRLRPLTSNQPKPMVPIVGKPCMEHIVELLKRHGFKDVIVPAWAAGFSAFGCACADFEYRYDKSVDIALRQQASEQEKVQAAQTIQTAWSELAAPTNCGVSTAPIGPG